MTREVISSTVIENVKNLVETFPQSEQFEVNEDTVLFGLSSKIDSLSLVSVIVDLEIHYATNLDVEFSLTDDRAMTRAISPFDNVKNLIDYIHELIVEL